MCGTVHTSPRWQLVFIRSTASCKRLSRPAGWGAGTRQLPRLAHVLLCARLEPGLRGGPRTGEAQTHQQHPGPRLLGHHTGPLPLAWPGWRQGRVPGSLALCPAGPWKVTCPRLALGRLLGDDPFCSHSGSPGASERGHEWPWARPPKRAVVGRGAERCSVGGAGRRERAFEHTEVSRPGPPGPGDQNPPVGSKSSEISYEPPTTWQT